VVPSESLTAMTGSETGKPKPDLFSRLDGSQVVLLSDLATEQIMRLIDSGQLTPGSRLPSERELSQRLGVSRTALREALRILESVGVLEHRVGRGRVVSRRRGDSHRALKGGGWLHDHHEELAELKHVLQLVEPVGILEVPAHFLPHVASESRAVCLRMEAAIAAGDVAQAAELDLEFHRALSQRTPNRLLRDIIANLINAFPDSVRVIYGMPKAARHSLDQHWAIVRALDAGSREEASRLLREHDATAHRFAAEQAVAQDE